LPVYKVPTEQSLSPSSTTTLRSCWMQTSTPTSPWNCSKRDDHDPISEVTAVRKTLSTLEKTGVFSKAIRDWRKRPDVEWTWEQLSDIGCTTTFTRDSVRIDYEGTTIIPGTPLPTTKLWHTPHLQLSTCQKMPTSPVPSPTLPNCPRLSHSHSRLSPPHLVNSQHSPRKQLLVRFSWTICQTRPQIPTLVHHHRKRSSAGPKPPEPTQHQDPHLIRRPRLRFFSAEPSVRRSHQLLLRCMYAVDRPDPHSSNRPFYHTFKHRQQLPPNCLRL
jgi:hypothetical protein